MAAQKKHFPRSTNPLAGVVPYPLSTAAAVPHAVIDQATVGVVLVE